MSQLLTEPDGFEERPLYISVNKVTLKEFDHRNLRSKSDRNEFLKRAKMDGLAAGDVEVLILRIDKSGYYEIHPE